MRRRADYNLLVVRSDGALVFRLTVPCRLARGGGIALAIVSVTLVLLVGDYVKLRQLTRDARSYVGQMAQQRELVDRVSERITDLQREASAWRALHARIWEAMGPDTATSRTGIGGAVAALTEPRGARPSAPEELERLAVQMQEEGDNLRALDRLATRAAKVLATLPSRWPVRGPVNSEFGQRPSPWNQNPEFHSGIDIGVQSGSPVRAPASGTVTFAGAHPEYGLTVMIDHGHEIRTVYGHLSKVSGHPGQRVERGALIGLSGNTGRSSGPHLHYEVQVKGRQVNPRAYLWE